MNGRFENTAFCILAPDGEERLTGSSRSPAMVLGSSGRGPQAAPGSSNDVVDGMNQIARSYRPKGVDEQMTLQDFHTFRQALNVASGDQRLLLFVAAPDSEKSRIRKVLQPIFASGEFTGRYHLDFGSSATDANWSDVIEKTSAKTGYVIIRADEFGQTGEVMGQLPLTASAENLKTALLAANERFAETEERKVYSEHVQEGRREDIFFEGGMPYGEDRDGDGEIDHVGGGKGKGKGKGPGRP